MAWHGAAGEPAWERLAAALRTARAEHGHVAEVRRQDDPHGADVVFRREDDALAAPESYRLRVDASGARVTAPTAAGLAHGATTLAQWITICSASLEVQGLDVTDRPDFAVRGFQLDVSRNRVPTLAELERLVERLARFKFNQLQLYLEHAFAYAGHEAVWRGFDPLTPEDVRTVAGWCSERHIELVPSQNSFGHLHRWLVHEPYRRLAECPDGIDHPFSPDPEPFSLCPTDPGSLRLLRDLYGQLLPCFPPGEFLNVGLDETLDLGLCRSKEACAARGRQRVYIDFLGQVQALAAEHGRRILFWGDVLLGHPDVEGNVDGEVEGDVEGEVQGDVEAADGRPSMDELLQEIPGDAVALAWGYEADHPWRETLARLAAARAKGGPAFWACPGTSSWNSFSGRVGNALRNTARAAVFAREFGAAGYLLCDWGDHGHLQPPIAGWPGLVAGADAAWNADLPVGDPASRREEGSGELQPEHRRTPGELAKLLDLHLPEAPGDALVALGDVHRLTGAAAANGSALFFQLLFADRPAAERRSEGMTEAGLAAVRRRLETLRLEELRPAGDDLAARELAWAADALDLGADLAAVRFAAGADVPLAGLPAAERRRLRRRRDELLEALGPLWTARSRPGGLKASRARWRRALAGLGP